MVLRKAELAPKLDLLCEKYQATNASTADTSKRDEDNRLDEPIQFDAPPKPYLQSTSRLTVVNRQHHMVCHPELHFHYCTAIESHQVFCELNQLAPWLAIEANLEEWTADKMIKIYENTVPKQGKVKPNIVIQITTSGCNIRCHTSSTKVQPPIQQIQPSTYRLPEPSA